MPHWQPKSIEEAKGRRRDRKSTNVETLSHHVKPENGADSSSLSEKSLVFQTRPGFGQMGTKCMVKANHLLAEISDKELTQYSVQIKPYVHSIMVNKAIMNDLVTFQRHTMLGGRLPVYDGRGTLYSAGPLPFTSKEFIIKLEEEKESTGLVYAMEREYRVRIKFVACANISQLRDFLSGKKVDAPVEVLKMIDIILKERASQRNVSVGRFFYSPNLKKPQPLGNGLQTWRGFYQSIKPTQMGLSLNIDMSSTAFIEPLPVIEFVAQILGKDVSSRPLSDAESVKVKKALRGVKVEVTHRGSMRRKYRVSGLTSQPTRELM